MVEKMTLSLALLASGSGTNAEAIMQAIQDKKLDATVKIVICNHIGAGVIARAQKFSVPCQILQHQNYSSREEYDQALIDVIRHSGADTVVLAGFMRIVTSKFIRAFSGRVLNIHPALLPSFPGVHGIPDAMSWGVKITGCTVHFVDEMMDHGSVIIQAAVPYIAGEDEEDLATRIHRQEHKIYPQALQWLAEGRLQTTADRAVRLLPSKHKKATIQAEAHVLVSPPLEDF